MKEYANALQHMKKNITQNKSFQNRIHLKIYTFFKSV
jgi:hypothetical protein